MKKLSDQMLVVEAVKWRGPTRAAKLFGWLAVATAFGVERRAQIVTVEWASQATRYRVWNEVHAFRNHLASLGYELTDDEVVELASVGRGPGQVRRGRATEPAL